MSDLSFVDDSEMASLEAEARKAASNKGITFEPEPSRCDCGSAPDGSRVYRYEGTLFKKSNGQSTFISTIRPVEWWWRARNILVDGPDFRDDET